MKKQHTQKMTVRVTAQTAYNLERLMLMSGQKTPGRVVDKLVREKMLALRGRNIEVVILWVAFLLGAVLTGTVIVFGYPV